MPKTPISMDFKANMDKKNKDGAASQLGWSCAHPLCVEIVRMFFLAILLYFDVNESSYM